jgi:DNA-binding NarL/FixJ family response regulator
MRREISAAPARERGGRIRVLIVDDHPAVRRGVRALLEQASDMDVVGEAADGAEGVAKARELAPDLVLMDASMPGIDGIEATRRLVAEHRHLRVVVLSAFGDRAGEAHRAGAVAHLLKDLEPAELLLGIRGAWAGPATASCTGA